MPTRGRYDKHPSILPVACERSTELSSLFLSLMMMSTDTTQLPTNLGTSRSGAQQLEDHLAEVVGPLGYEVIAVELIGSGRGRVIRVYLDRAEGISLDDCTRMGPVISASLDALEVDPRAGELTGLLHDPYTLEVSSPGIERLLTRRSHYERFLESRVVVKTRRPILGDGGGDPKQKTFHGYIQRTQPSPGAEADDRSGVVILREVDGERRYWIPLADIRRANLVYEG